MKLKLKIGAVGALAVTLVALSVFGFRHQSSDAAVGCASSQDITATGTAGGPTNCNVFIIFGRPISPTTATGGAQSCANAPGARAVTVANFPPASGADSSSMNTTLTFKYKWNVSAIGSRNDARR